MTNAIQISKRLDDGTILVIGGETPDEFVANVTPFMDPAPIMELFKTLVPVSAGHDVMQAAQSAAFATLGATPIEQPQAAPQQQYQQPAQAAPSVPNQPYQQASSGPLSEPPGQPKFCPHGQRKWVSKVGQKGPWGAWMCPSEQGDPSKCSPEWYSTR